MSAAKSASLFQVIGRFLDEYKNTTNSKLKIIDAYLVYVFLTGVLQFAYCCLVGTFPFNSFLSGFISTVASFVLGGKFGFYTLEKCHSNFIWQSPLCVKSSICQVDTLVFFLLKSHIYAFSQSFKTAVYLNFSIVRYIIPETLRHTCVQPHLSFPMGLSSLYLYF